MNNKSALSFRRGDWLAITAVILFALAAAAAYLPSAQSSESAVVQVFQDGSLIKELPLQSDAAFEISGPYTNQVEIRDGKVCIKASSCPGEDCVHTGPVSQSGRSIVCLPNRTEIRISGQSDVDFVVG